MKTTLALLTGLGLTGLMVAEPILPPVPLYGVPPEIARQLNQQMQQVEGQLQRQLILDPAGLPEMKIPDGIRDDDNTAVKWSCVNGAFTWKKSTLKERFVVTGTIDATGTQPSLVEYFDGTANRKYEKWADVPEELKARILVGIKSCVEPELP